MRVGIFLQNNKKGGLDTFVIQLINYWPKTDELYLFCNDNHPGLSNLSNEIERDVIFVEYKIFQIEGMFKIKNSPLINLYYFFKKLYYFIFGIFHLVLKAKKLFSNLDLQALLVVNGGYPGGEACLSALIAWGKLNRHNKAWMNYHNLIKPDSDSIFSIRKLKYFLLNREVAKNTEGFVTVSQNCMQTLTNLPIFDNIQRRYIYNGVELEHPKKIQNIKSQLPFGERDIYILMLAVYESRKGHTFIFEVMDVLFNKFPNLHLVVCGYGSEWEMKKIDKVRRSFASSDHVHLFEFQKDKVNLLKESELLVIPSQSYESFGYTAVEAMLCKKAVVSTDIGGLPEVIRNNETGYVVNHKDIKGFADAITDLLDNNKKRYQFGEAGYKRAKSYFVPDIMAKAYYNIVHGDQETIHKV